MMNAYKMNPRRLNIKSSYGQLPKLSEKTRLKRLLVYKAVICFKGRSGYRGLPRLPLCLTNQIRICRPKKSWAPSTPRGCMRSLDQKTNVGNLGRRTTTILETNKKTTVLLWLDFTIYFIFTSLIHGQITWRCINHLSSPDGIKWVWKFSETLPLSNLALFVILGSM